jgi:hypothetical protein
VADRLVKMEKKDLKNKMKIKNEIEGGEKQ